jgi:hypothetical protein
MEINAGQLMTNPDRSHRQIGFLGLDPLDAAAEEEEEDDLSESLSFDEEPEAVGEAEPEAQSESVPEAEPMAGLDDEPDAEPFEEPPAAAFAALVAELGEQAGLRRRPIIFDHDDDALVSPPEWTEGEPIAAPPANEAPVPPPEYDWRHADVPLDEPPGLPVAETEAEEFQPGEFAPEQPVEPLADLPAEEPLEEEAFGAAEEIAPAADAEPAELAAFEAREDGEFEYAEPDEEGTDDEDTDDEDMGYGSLIKAGSRHADRTSDHDDPDDAAADIEAPEISGGFAPEPPVLAEEEPSWELPEPEPEPESTEWPEPEFATTHDEAVWPSEETPVPDAAELPDDLSEPVEQGWTALPAAAAREDDFDDWDPLPEPAGLPPVETVFLPEPPPIAVAHHSLRARVLQAQKPRKSATDRIRTVLDWLAQRFGEIVLPRFKRLLAWAKDRWESYRAGRSQD